MGIMETFDFQPSIRLVFGPNQIDQLGQLTKELAHPSKVLLITDQGVAKAGILDRAIDALKSMDIDTHIFQEVTPNPTTKDVQNATNLAHKIGNIGLIVGLGGGSAMDCAKGVNFLLTNGGTMENYWGFGKATQPMLPSIGIPTTAGTGSEAQSYALISQADTHIKMACGDRKARFRAVILDPVLTETMPAQVAALTGFDAISHAIESYVSTKGNSMSRLFAKSAWQMLSQNFELALQPNSDSDVRGQMLLGANLAGMAIECSMLGAAHACANPLTANYQITHGLAVSLMLPHVVELNSKKVGNLYQQLSTDLASSIRHFQSVANLPSRLRDTGIPRSDLNDLAVSASEQWTGNFNPVLLTDEVLVQLYERAY